MFFNHGVQLPPERITGAVGSSVSSRGGVSPKTYVQGQATSNHASNEEFMKDKDIAILNDEYGISSSEIEEEEFIRKHKRNFLESSLTYALTEDDPLVYGPIVNRCIKQLFAMVESLPKADPYPEPKGRSGKTVKGHSPFWSSAPSGSSGWLTDAENKKNNNKSHSPLGIKNKKKKKAVR